MKTLTERAEEARKELIQRTRDTDLQELVMTTLALTIAEGWDSGFEQGYDLGLGHKVSGNVV